MHVVFVVVVDAVVGIVLVLFRFFFNFIVLTHTAVY